MDRREARQHCRLKYSYFLFCRHENARATAAAEASSFTRASILHASAALTPGVGRPTEPYNRRELGPQHLL